MTYNIHALHSGSLTELPGTFGDSPARWTWWDDYAIARLGVGDDWEDAACVGGGYFFAVLTTGHIIYRIAASNMAVTSLTSANNMIGGDCCYAAGKLYVLWGDSTGGNPLKIERIDVATMTSDATFTVAGSNAGAKPSICTDGTSLYALQDNAPMTVWKIGNITGAMSITSSYVFINEPANEQGHSIRYDGSNVYGSTVQRTHFRINPSTMLPDWIVSPPTLLNGQYFPLSNMHDDIAFDTNNVYFTGVTNYQATTDKFNGPHILDKATGRSVSNIQDLARAGSLGIESDISTGQVYWGAGDLGSTVNAKHLTDAIRQRAMMTGSAPDDLWWDGTYLWTIEFRVRQSQQPIVSRWSAVSGHLGQGRVKALQQGTVSHPNYYQSTLVDAAGCYTGISFSFDALPVGDHMTVLTIQHSGDIAQVQVEANGDLNFIFNTNAPVRLAAGLSIAQHMLELRYDQITGRYRGYLDEIPSLDVSLGAGQGVTSIVYGPWDAQIDQTLHFTMHTAFDIGMSDTDWVALGRPRWGNVTALRIAPQLDGVLGDWARTGETGNARAIDDYADLIAGATGDNGDTSYVDATGTTEAWDSFKLQTFAPIYPRALRIYARAKSTSSPVGTFAIGYSDVLNPDKTANWAFGSTQTPTASYAAYASQFMRDQASAAFLSDAQAFHSIAVKKFSSGASQNVRVTQLAVTFLASTNPAVLPWDYPAAPAKTTLDVTERGFAQQLVADSITEQMNTAERGFAVRLIEGTSTMTLAAVSGQATVANVILSPILKLSAVAGAASVTMPVSVVTTLTLSGISGTSSATVLVGTGAKLSLSAVAGQSSVNNLILSPILNLSAVAGSASVSLILIVPLGLSPIAGQATVAPIMLTFPGSGAISLSAVAGVATVTATMTATTIMALGIVAGIATVPNISVSVPTTITVQSISGLATVALSVTVTDQLALSAVGGLATVANLTLTLGAVLSIPPLTNFATVLPLTFVSGTMTLQAVNGQSNALAVLSTQVTLLLAPVSGLTTPIVFLNVTSAIAIVVKRGIFDGNVKKPGQWVPIVAKHGVHG